MTTFRPRQIEISTETADAHTGHHAAPPKRDTAITGLLGGGRHNPILQARIPRAPQSWGYIICTWIINHKRVAYEVGGGGDETEIEMQNGFGA